MMQWRLHGDGKSVPPGDVVGPGERLTWPRTVSVGVQHVVAMFGGTFLVPLLTGFPPSTTLLFSGIGTLVFLLITANRLPSYLGSSFAFIAPITVAKADAGPGAALLGIVAVGAALAAVGALVIRYGKQWVDALLPPVVSGTIVALIGLNLAPAAKEGFDAGPFTATVTLLVVILVTVLFRGMLSRLAIFAGVVVGYAVAAVSGQIDLSPVESAPWFGVPAFSHPSNPFADPTVWAVLPAFLPIVLVLVAENLGHVRGVAQMTDPSVQELTGRALFADGVSTMLAGSCGGSGTTTYGENIGVMATTRIYSTAAYWAAALAAIALGLSPKVGALINSVTPGIIGGITTALYGLIAVIGFKIWIDNKVDFSRPVNQLTAGVALIMAVADFSLSAGDMVFNGIAIGTVAAVVVFHGMTAIGRRRGTL